MKCPRHQVWLRFDERTTESVPDGLGGYGVERSFAVERYACPIEDCDELEERAA